MCQQLAGTTDTHAPFSVFQMHLCMHMMCRHCHSLDKHILILLLVLIDAILSFQKNLW